jgi:protein-S-isoprenylcysteine O-methyltransferase Ste14
VKREPAVSALAVAWGGSALFAVSLIWFVYCYLVRFDTLDGASTVPTGARAFIRPAGVDVLLFSIFSLHHSVFARSGAKAIVLKAVPPYLERSVYTWVASVLFLLVCTLWQPVPGTLYRLEGPWRAGAYALQLLGLLLTVHASRLLDALDLAGVRPVQRARRGDPPKHVPLETGGIYGFVRHPLYFAWALFVFATPAMTGTRAVFAVVSTAYLALAIPWEERALIDTFGDAYRAYQRRVRWRMVPGLY